MSTRPLRGLFLGSGAGMAEPGVAEWVVELAGVSATDLELLYLGTASYDAAGPRERQTARFCELGCRVAVLEVATRVPEAAEMSELVARADAVLVSGGNTLYAVDRWIDLGLDQLLREAVRRGAVLCGGSAGAICWFDGGHSDSMDPTSYRHPVPVDDPRASDWHYTRVDGLGLLPGLLCPHYGATQRNGVLRATDFEAMVRRHPGERGLGLDDWAGLLIDGERYRVVASDGRPGTVAGAGFVADGSGRPGLWVVEADRSSVTRTLAPTDGHLADLLRPASVIVPDPLLATARAENPPPAA